MGIQRLYKAISPSFRKRRMQQFATYFNIATETRILDLGGTPFNWRLLDTHPELILLNIKPSWRGSTRQVVADGCNLPFDEGAFDIVFSNSVIEHLSTLENQRRFAEECRRVGLAYYVQTPNKWFPVEPHYIGLFIHYLPRSIQRRLIRWFTVRGWLTRPSQSECDTLIKELRLLDKAELGVLFPDATIELEHLLGMTKSVIAIRRSAVNECPG